MNWDDIPEALWPYVAHGVEFSSQSKDQWVGTAPFSDKPNKFYVNPKNGLWDEKLLGLKGNDITFFGEMLKVYRAGLTDEALADLCTNRGLPPEAFTAAHIGFDGKHYMLPIYSSKGTIRDIKRWSFKSARLMVTKGQKSQLYGMDELAKAKKGSRVYVCEGEWDRIALRWLLKKLKLEGIVVGTPGASVFKEEWVRFFDGKEVVWMGDNDEAGDKGAALIRERFFNSGSKLLYLNWPETWEDGYDVRDFIVYARKNAVKLSESWSKLESLISDVHRRDDGTDEFSARSDEETDTFLEDEEAPTFDDLCGTFEKYLSMDTEMRFALLFVASIIYSQQITTSEPLWAYLVAPAGGGKSVILSSMSGHRRTFYRSTITPNTLVSGFKTTNDPSILPKMNNKTFIIKDFTATLAGPDFMFEETMAILRDAYDGDFTKSYGNDVVRSYRNLHFSIIAGVTPIIHSKPQAMMGERFLKLCMRDVGFDEKLERLMATARSPETDANMQAELQEATAKFLSRRVDMESLPDLPRPFRLKIAGLALLVAKLRASVQRDQRDPDRLLYRPEAETGNRPMRQLCKMAHAVKFVLRKDSFDEDVWNFLQRVALDSCVGFNIEILSALRDSDEGTMTISDISKCLRISASTVTRNLQDLEALGVLKRSSMTSTGGRKATLWQLSESTERAVKLAGIDASLSGKRSKKLFRTDPSGGRGKRPKAHTGL